MMDLQIIFENARKVARKMVLLDDRQINDIINDTATLIVENTGYILDENRKDLQRMSPDDPKYDRLLLTEERIRGLADDQRNVTRLPSPLDRVLSSVVQPNGLLIEKVSVPFGVIGVIYEARPNVTLDVFSLCLKSGNACILKGGSDAEYSSRAIVSLIHRVLETHGLDTAIATLLPAGREATAALLKAEGFVDLIIPRGSSSLINYVRENASIPVIETGAGICHAYFDVYADKQKGAAIIENAKTRRVSVCNALDCLLIHKDRLADLPDICAGMQEKNVKIYADPAAYAVLKRQYKDGLLEKALPESFGTEFLSYTMAVKTVSGIEEALEHIAIYSSKHSECIISESEENQRYFLNLVDAACVYSNAPTSFTDGAQFGLGAEIGISTQKLHARGPMGLEELTTYKWIIRGNGQIRG